jgi:hypothetical protein
VSGLPTYFGLVSFRYEPAGKILRVSVERMPRDGIGSELPVPVKLVGGW